MDIKMTVFEIHLAICVETVDIWNNPRKVQFLRYADELDDYNQILESHALDNTLPSAEEWGNVINGLEYMLDVGMKIKPIVDRAKDLAAHPEYFDAELNEVQRIRYLEKADKSCLAYTKIEK